MIKTDYSQLADILPPGSSPFIISLLEDYQPELVFSQRKSRRLGFYQVSTKQTVERISLNLNQKPLGLLITLLHEVAHMHVYHKHGRAATPHGKEWKSVFAALLNGMAAIGTLPLEDVKVIRLVAHHPTASYYSKVDISRFLVAHDEAYAEKVLKLLYDLDQGSKFRMTDGRVFHKGEIVRTRFRCRLEGTRKIFLIGGYVPVEPVI